MPDLEFAHTVLVLGVEPLDAAPILDLRIRKGVRRNGVQLIVASARPSALDANAKVLVRYPPGDDAGFLAELDAELAGDARSDVARLLRDGGEDVVIVWGERIDAEALAAPTEHRRPARAGRARGRGSARDPGRCQRPRAARGRGAAERGAGYAEAEPGWGTRLIGDATVAGELNALYLFQTDPVRDFQTARCGSVAMHDASLVVAHASVLTEGLREHASVVFPAESHAEKEGTVIHPDGRIQRLRSAIGHPGEVEAGWAVLAEVGAARRVRPRGADER